MQPEHIQHQKHILSWSNLLLFNALLKSKFSKTISIKSQHLAMSSCIIKEEDIMTACPTHISCPLRNVTIKFPDNSCVDHKEIVQIICPSFNPIRCWNGNCRKSLSDCPSLVHCPDNSCRSSKVLCQKPSNKIIFFSFFSKNFSFKL